MSETRTISVPSIALNYDEGMLESVGIGGEIFRRETPLSAENAQLKSENASLRGSVRWFVIENVELRDLVSDMYEDQCDDAHRWKYRDRMRNLGIEVPK